MCSVAALMLLVLIACGGEDEQQEAQGSAAVPVAVSEVAPATFQAIVRGTGEVSAVETIELLAETAGVVESLHFSEGARVERGELLAVIDSAPLERELEARRAAREGALAALRLAEQTLERIRTLTERGSASAEELDRAASSFEQATARLEQLKAEVETLEERLADARVKAPASGEVAERLVDPGDFVQIGSPLAVLYTTHMLELAVDLPESALGRLAEGQKVEARISAAGDERVQGRIDYIAPALEPTTRTVRVKARVTDPEGRLRPGAFAAAQVVVETRRQRPSVPEEALVSTRTGYLVFVVDENAVAHRREVAIGLRKPGLVEISDGLELGETVVRRGHMSLHDGAEVEVVESLAEDSGERPQ